MTRPAFFTLSLSSKCKERFRHVQIVLDETRRETFRAWNGAANGERSRRDDRRRRSDDDARFESLPCWLARSEETGVACARPQKKKAIDHARDEESSRERAETEAKAKEKNDSRGPLNGEQRSQFSSRRKDLSVDVHDRTLLAFSLVRRARFPFTFHFCAHVLGIQNCPCLCASAIERERPKSNDDDRLVKRRRDTIDFSMGAS